MGGLDAAKVCSAVQELGAGAHGVAAIRRKLAAATGAKLPDAAWNDEVIRLLRDAVDAGALEQLGSRATFLCAFEATNAVPPQSAAPRARRGTKAKAKQQKSTKRKKSAAAARDSDENDSDDEPLVVPPLPAAKKARTAKAAKPKKSKNATMQSTAEDAPGSVAAASFTPRWFWAGDKSGGMQNKWVEFGANVSKKLEQRWNVPRPAGQVRGQIATDSERFVDLDAMMQARKDNPTRVRGVVRIATTAELAQQYAKPPI